MLRPPLALLVLLSIAAATCSVYDDSLLHHTDAGGLADAATDGDAAQGDASEAEAPYDDAVEALPDVPAETPGDVVADVDPRACDSCKAPSLARPPCPGAGADSASGQPIVFAMRTLSMGLSQGSDLNAWKEIGYDLDCMETLPAGAPLSCLSAEPLTMEDGESGRDNSFGRNVCGGIRLLSIQGLLPDIEAEANAKLEAGTFGWLFEVREYNGADDDPVVQVTAHPSTGVFDGASSKTPLWDGTDSWSVDSSSMQGGAATYADHAAFVSAGVVVAHFTGPLPFTIRGHASALMLELANVTVTMRLSSDRKEVVQGVISSRSPLTQVIEAVDAFAAQAGKCPGVNKNVDDARATMLKTADVLMSEFNEPSTACDGVSAAFGFSAQAARMGTVVDPVPVIVPPCGDSGT